MIRGLPGLQRRATLLDQLRSEMDSLPEVIEDEGQLESVLTTPSSALVEFSRDLVGPIVVLGAGGKMGPTLCVLLQRALEQSGAGAKVIAASRFSNPAARQWLDDRGVRTIVADSLRRESIAELPDAENVIYLIGNKFGTSGNPSPTWAINTIAPSIAMERFRASRIVALSTGNVYPFVPVAGGGSVETDALEPIGEYAHAAIGRERIFDYYSREQETPVAMVRLNYATDLRYGVLTDLATKVAAGEPIDLTQGYFNCIWQGDANEFIIRSLGLATSPVNPINLTSAETFSVRQVASKFGELMQREVQFVGAESETALLNNASKCFDAFGNPPTPMERVIRWIAHWVLSGQALLGKPTHFEVRDGAF